MKTWQIEMGVVAAVLAAVALANGARPVEWIGSAAVLAAFGHSSIADRLAEREALKSKPDVDCARLLVWYFVAKELAWATYFVATGSWAALVGCGVFAAYPAWRRFYRRRRPIARA